ncbi:MAG TPA: hypothetical protein VMV46_21715 [Thermoanaerobaculia bacterium]|nr:hypothetical protein [Thermoanaerobaculia bacterium]
MGSQARSVGSPGELAWLVVALLVPLLYAGMYAGDGVIHLAFAESAAEGRFFELNPGEPVAGETSPGFMLLVALPMRWLGAPATPLAVQVAGYLGWCLLVLLVWRVALRLLGDRRWALATAVVAGLVPGSAYNTVVGMENGWFALVIWGAIALSLAPASRHQPARGAAIGALLGVACWLRPEGLVLAGLWALAEAAQGRRSRALTGGAVAALLIAAALWFHHAHTGLWLPASGRARVLAAHLDSWTLGPLVFDPTPAIRLAAYLPLGLGLPLGLRRLGEEERHRGVWRLVAATTLVFLALYSTLLGAAHFGRYAIFLMPGIVLLAARGWRRALARSGTGAQRGWARRLAAAALLWLLAVFAVETAWRARGASHRMVALLRRAPAERTATTDRLLAELGAPRDPAAPLIVALVEVQLRYWLDERVVVRSLDGRVDPLLLDFAGPEGVDYLGYLAAREVDAVLGLPDSGALEPLRLLSPGAELALGELRFRRVGAAPHFLVARTAVAQGR